MGEMPMKGGPMGEMPAPRRRTGAKTILLTGFQPFGGLTENPALEILKRVPRTVGGCAVERAEIPVTYEGCSRVAVEAVERVRPCAVVMVGQARGRADIEVERVAINVDDCDSPDNDGVVRQGVAVVEGGPAERAGLQQYDFIYSVDGVRVTSFAELTTELDKHEAGDTVEIQVCRYAQVNVVDNSMMNNNFYGFYGNNSSCSSSRYSIYVSGGYEMVTKSVTLEILDD